MGKDREVSLTNTNKTGTKNKNNLLRPSLESLRRTRSKSDDSRAVRVSTYVLEKRR